MTKSYFNGRTVSFTYSKGYLLRQGVMLRRQPQAARRGPTTKWRLRRTSTRSTSRCPSASRFPTMSMECPAGLVCVDHPGTIDLSRLEPDLKAPVPASNGGAADGRPEEHRDPGHEHFITTLTVASGVVERRRHRSHQLERMERDQRPQVLHLLEPAGHGEVDHRDHPDELVPVLLGQLDRSASAWCRRLSRSRWSSTPRPS